MRINKKRLTFKAGFTLIEIIVTIAILGIVLTMAYSMGAFGSISFNNGSAKADIQSNTRLVANYITKELRYSSDVIILSTLPAKEDLIENYKYIYVDKDGILMQYDKSKNPNPTIVGDASNKINILNFEIKDSKTVEFKVEEKFKNQTFQLDSTVLLLNIGDSALDNGSTGKVVAYTTKPITTNINANPVQLIKITAPLDSHSILINGGTLQLKSTVTPDDAIQTVYWSVDNIDIATIDTEGLLTTAQNTKEGDRIIVKATAQDGSGKVSEPYEVTTVKNCTVIPNTTNIYILCEDTVSMKRPIKLRWYVNPNRTEVPIIEWSVSNMSKKSNKSNKEKVIIEDEMLKIHDNSVSDVEVTIQATFKGEKPITYTKKITVVKDKKKNK